MVESGEPSESSARFELLVQSVTDYAIYMLDPIGVVVSWNSGAERVKGYCASEIIGQNFSRFYTEEDRAGGVPESVLRMAARKGHFAAEGWRLRQDGTRFWAYAVIDPISGPDGSLIGFAIVTRDLTDRRQAEEELRHSEERFRLLVQSVTDYAIYMLDQQGNVTSWNAGAERFKGYTADEIIGRNFRQFYPDEDRAAGVPERALETARREGRFEAEGWRLRKDGSRFWASVVIDPVISPAGDLIGFAKITRDLTERRETQLALERAQQAYFQSQKLEAIGRLTGGVAHDFNNLLSAITGSLELAGRRLAEGQDISQLLENALHAADRGANLTQRMLAFARKQDLRLQPVDLNSVIREMAGMVQRAIGPAIAIETRFPLALASVCGDPAQLELAILNLCVNARDAMPDGGRITISARQEVPPERLGLGEGHFVRLSVADEGEGMAPEVLEHAIEPFFTTKGVGKGSGLGLSMVMGMAEQCGGKLDLISAMGVGTTVDLWLPVTAAGEAAMEAVPTERVPQTRRLTILAVDDDPLILMNTAETLSYFGHTVHDAISGAAALTVLADHTIDLLITDFAMPGMSGAELIAAARARQPGIAALLISGYADLPTDVILDAPRLAKPFREEELARAVAEIATKGCYPSG